MGVSPDLTNPGILHVASVNQNGLGMPTATTTSSAPTTRMVKAKEAYQAYPKSCSGIEPPTPGATPSRVIALKRPWPACNGARSSCATPTSRTTQDGGRDQKLAPQLDWDAFFKAAQVTTRGQDHRGPARTTCRAWVACSKTPVSDWQLYLKARALDGAAPC